MIKIKTLLILSILFISIQSCAGTLPKYVPKYEDLHKSAYGAFIELEMDDSSEITGELIAIDNDYIYVLSDISDSNSSKDFTKIEKKVTKFSTEKMRGFKINYAQDRNYNLLFLSSLIVTYFHGKYIILTLPLNLIGMGIITHSGSTAFELTNKDLTLNELKMYARFPQGIPKPLLIDLVK